MVIGKSIQNNSYFSYLFVSTLAFGLSFDSGNVKEFLMFFKYVSENMFCENKRKVFQLPVHRNTEEVENWSSWENHIHSFVHVTQPDREEPMTRVHHIDCIKHHCSHWHGQIWTSSVILSKSVYDGKLKYLENWNNAGFLMEKITKLYI